MRTKAYSSKAQYSTGLTIESVTLNDNFNTFQIDAKFNNIIETFRSPNVIGFLSYRLLANDLTASTPFRVLSKKQAEGFNKLGIDKQRTLRILINKLDSLTLLSTSHPEENKIIEALKIYKYDDKSLLSNISISRLLRTDYIDIYAETDNANLSAFIVNEIGKSFLSFYNSLSSVRSSESISSLEKQVTSKSREFDSIYNSLQNTKQGAVGDISAQITSLMGIIQSYEGKLGEEKAAYNRSQAQLNNINTQIQGLKANAQQAEGNNTVNVASIRKQISDLENDKAANPSQAAVIDQKIRALQRELVEKSRKKPGNNADETLLADLIQKKYTAEAEMVSAERNIKEFESTIRKYQGQINNLAGKDVGIEREQTMAEITSKELANIKDRFETVQGKKEGVGMNFKQTLFGQPAIEAESYRPILTTAIAGVSTFMTLCFIIILLDLVNPSLQTLLAYKRVFKSTPIGILSNLNLKKSDVPAIISNTSLALNAKNSKYLRFRTVVHSLRLKLLASDKHSYLISSFYPGEGKTLIIEALAQSLKMAGKSVLIIDANLMHNSMTEKYSAKPELIQFLNGDIPLKDAVTSTGENGFDVIGTSTTNNTFSELVGNQLVKIKELSSSSDYDFVLVEGPVMQYHIGAFELGDAVDGIINVVSAQSVVDSNYKAAVERLQEKHGKLVGMVYNLVLEDNIPNS